MRAVATSYPLFWAISCFVLALLGDGAHSLKSNARSRIASLRSQADAKHLVATVVPPSLALNRGRCPAVSFAVWVSRPGRVHPMTNARRHPT